MTWLVAVGKQGRCTACGIGRRCVISLKPPRGSRCRFVAAGRAVPPPTLRRGLLPCPHQRGGLCQDHPAPERTRETSGAPVAAATTVARTRATSWGCTGAPSPTPPSAAVSSVTGRCNNGSRCERRRATHSAALPLRPASPCENSSAPQHQSGGENSTVSAPMPSSGRQQRPSPVGGRRRPRPTAGLLLLRPRQRRVERRQPPQ
jgi:hypothetical protein